MKQCNSCQEWIPRKYQFCPECGEKQSTSNNEDSNPSDNTGCFISIIILLVIIIVGGISFYMYNRGAFGSFFNDTTTDTVSYDSIEGEYINGLPSELYLTTATFLNNQSVKVELKINSKGNVEGRFIEKNGASSTRLKGKGNKEDGVITVKNDQAAIELILTPSNAGHGSYECSWKYKGKSGDSYFYPSEKPVERPQKETSSANDQNKKTNDSTTTLKASEKVSIDTVSQKASTKKDASTKQDIQSKIIEKFNKQHTQ